MDLGFQRCVDKVSLSNDMIKLKIVFWSLLIAAVLAWPLRWVLLFFLKDDQVCTKITDTSKIKKVKNQYPNSVFVQMKSVKPTRIYVTAHVK